MSEEKNKVTVTIRKKEYTIIANESTDYIMSVANELDERISQVSGANAALGAEKSIILAALNLCDDYLKMRQTNNALQRQVMKCAKEMEKLQQAAETASAGDDETDELRRQIVQYSEELRKTESEIKRLRKEAEETKISADKEAEYETKIKEMQAEHRKEVETLRAEFARKEEEMLDMIDHL
jgi:cell division protein ZapA